MKKNSEIEYPGEALLLMNMKWPQYYMDLTYSPHALKRIKERRQNRLLSYPDRIRITPDNLYKGYTTNGWWIHKVVVKMRFSNDEWIYLVIMLDKKVVKSVWFEKIT